MEPNNTVGTPEEQKNIPNEAEVEMQATVVADEVANPVELPKENTMAEGAGAKKGGKGMLIAVILLALIALGGVGFGVWTMINGNGEVAQLKEKNSELQKQNNALSDKLAENGSSTDGGGTTEVVKESAIDNELAQNLIDPYLDSFNYLSNMFDYDFNEDVKMEIVYKNTPFGRVWVDTDIIAIRYNDANEEYQQLFGGDLEKRDYVAGHSDIFEYDTEKNWFKVSPFQGGGAGLGMITAVKDALIDGNNIIVNVYHEVTHFCGVAEGDYCISAPYPSQSFIGTSMSDPVVKGFVEKFADRIPVYKMTFAKDSGRYVLKNVEKV